MAQVKRGAIYYADLDPVKGSEQGGVRPVLIIQNEAGNTHSPTVIIAAITTNQAKAKLPTHIKLQLQLGTQNKACLILLEQIRTIDKKRLIDPIGNLTAQQQKQVDAGLLISLGL